MSVDLDWLSSLKKKSKWKWVLALIPVLIFLGVKVFLSSQTDKARDDIKKANEKDRALKDKADKASHEADKLKVSADEDEKNIADHKSGEDWHKG